MAELVYAADSFRIKICGSNDRESSSLSLSTMKDCLKCYGFGVNMEKCMDCNGLGIFILPMGRLEEKEEYIDGYMDEGEYESDVDFSDDFPY